MPRRPHPREAATDSPGLPADVRRRTAGGLLLLSVSAWAFVAAGGGVAGSLALRVTLGPVDQDYPPWLPVVQLALAGWWFALAAAGCVCRVWGYRLCRPAAARYDLGPWASAAAAGAGLAAAGVLAVVPVIVGKPGLHLTPLGLGFVMIGLTTGFVGVLAEFAFMSVLHRLLWETAGWQAAGQTGRYVVAFVFGVVAAVGAVCVGAMAAILTYTHPDPAETVPPAKVIGGLVVAAVCGCGGYLAWRFSRLLKLARAALAQPEPTPDRPVPHQ